MKQLIPFSIFFSSLSAGLAGSVSLEGTGASESSGNGYAFVIPNLDGLGDGEFNSLAYRPLPISSDDPDGLGPRDPGDEQLSGSFNLGSLTWDDAAITGVGVETIAVTSSMFAFDFSSYNDSVKTELQVPVAVPVTAEIVLSKIEGVGLQFVNGVLETANFTADLTWTPTLGGFPQTIEPYAGQLKVENGTFTFDLSNEPQDWTIGGGAADVLFEFDLIATPDALKVELPDSPITPSLMILDVGEAEVVLQISFSRSGDESFFLEKSNTLVDDDWETIGSVFSATETVLLEVSRASERTFYRVAKAPAEQEER